MMSTGGTLAGALAPRRLRQRRPPSKTQLYTLLFLMVLFWAYNFVVVKTAIQHLPGMVMVGLRIALATLFIVPYYWSRGPHHVEWSELPRLMLIGALGVSVNQFFFVLGIERTSVAHAAITVGLSPMIVLAMSSWVGHERPSARKIVGMAVALGGVLFIQLSKGGDSRATLLGDFCIFLSIVSFAIFTVFGKHMTESHGGAVVNTWAYVGGTLLFAPLALWQGWGFDFSTVPGTVWLGILYMAVFPSVLSYLIFYWALTHIPASRVSAFSYLNPFLATLFAILMLGESLSPAFITGGLLVLLGVFVTERG
ncbi:MAG: DMT family transporter [Acidobacteria bacterium]|nr:DMT family transporter [Acidobacteriota bacterium]